MTFSSEKLEAEKNVKKRKRCEEIILMDSAKRTKLFVQSLVEVSNFLFRGWILDIINTLTLDPEEKTKIDKLISFMKRANNLRSLVNLRCFRAFDTTIRFEIIIMPFSDESLKVVWKDVDYQSKQCIQTFLLMKEFTNTDSRATKKEIKYRDFKYDDLVNEYLDLGLSFFLLMREILYLDFPSQEKVIAKAAAVYISDLLNSYKAENCISQIESISPSIDDIEKEEDDNLQLTEGLLIRNLNTLKILFSKNTIEKSELQGILTDCIEGIFAA